MCGVRPTHPIFFEGVHLEEQQPDQPVGTSIDVGAIFFVHQSCRAGLSTADPGHNSPGPGSPVSVSNFTSYVPFVACFPFCNFALIAFSSG